MWTREPVRWQTVLTTDQSMDDVMARVRAWAQQADARTVRQHAQTITARCGSRAAYRLFGLMAGPEQMPLRWTATVTPDGTRTRIDLDFGSDAGWYLFRADAAIVAYLERFRAIADEIGAAAGHARRRSAEVVGPARRGVLGGVAQQFGRGRVLTFAILFAVVLVALVLSCVMIVVGGGDVTLLATQLGLLVIVFALLLVEVGSRRGGHVSAVWTGLLVLGSAAAIAGFAVQFFTPGTAIIDRIVQAVLALAVVCTTISVIVTNSRRRLGAPPRPSRPPD